MLRILLTVLLFGSAMWLQAAPSSPKWPLESLSAKRSALAEQFAAQGRRLTSGTMFPLQLELQGEVDQQLLAALGSLGIATDFASEKYASASVTVTNEKQLDALLLLPGVKRVAAPAPFVTRAGSVQSRAPSALRSTGNELGRGSGQTIGVISDSFARTAAVRDADTTPPSGIAGNLQGSGPQDSGDLPAVVNLIDEGAADGSDEGAAMAELAFDIAPEAAIAFHTAGTSEAAFATAIDTLCSNNRATVVVDDIGFLLEPYYQDGFVAQAAARCVAAGIPFVSAVGNDGDKGYRQVFRDIDPVDDEPGSDVNFTPSGNDLHDWGSGDGFLRVTIPAGESTFAVLQWNQPNEKVSPSNGSQIDLDFYATRAETVAALNPSHPDFEARSIVGQGTSGNPSGDAAEIVVLEADAGSDTTFYLAIEHYAGSQESIPQASGVDLELRLLLIGPLDSAEYAFDGPTAWGHVAAEGVVSTAAVAWWEAPDFAPERFSSPAIDPEPYTSRGGILEIPFNTSGDYAPSQRIVPTVSGVDGSNNTFFGQDFQAGQSPGFGEPDGAPNFFGTSAAAPNVAAVIALLRAAQPGAGPAFISEALQASAVDVDGNRAASGDDDVSGAGLVDAGAARDYLQNNRIAPTPVPAASSGGGGSCFIATAAYGSYWHEHLLVLRAFRDRVLQQSAAGRWFIDRYYQYSPPLAAFIAEREGLKWLVRTLLTPLVWALKYPALPVSLALLLMAAIARRHTPALISHFHRGSQ